MANVNAWDTVREDFPFLGRRVNGRQIAYLDNAGTTQKPRQTSEAVMRLYSDGISNVHRAVNFLTEEVTREFEESRDRIAAFIGADARELVLVGNSTQGIDVVCRSLCIKGIPRVLTTTLEHHSNLLPWIHCGQVEFVKWSIGEGVDLEDFSRKLRSKPDLVAIASASNFLGVVHPVREMTARCREAGVPVLVDASQSVAHEPVDVRDLDCDYLVFSGHKMYGPSGVGVLYVRSDVLGRMEPAVLGGGMVREVSVDRMVLQDAPLRFEAGTPNIEGVVGLGAAAQYLSRLGLEEIKRHECVLIQYAKRRLCEVQGVALYGPEPGQPCAPLVSFDVRGLDVSAVAKTLANRSGVIVRSGFHCAQPAHQQLGLGPTVRASLGVYNTKDEIDLMAEVLRELSDLMS